MHWMLAVWLLVLGVLAAPQQGAGFKGAETQGGVELEPNGLAWGGDEGVDIGPEADPNGLRAADGGAEIEPDG